MLGKMESIGHPCYDPYDDHDIFICNQIFHVAIWIWQR